MTINTTLPGVVVGAEMVCSAWMAGNGSARITGVDMAGHTDIICVVGGVKWFVWMARVKQLFNTGIAADKESARNLV